MEVEFGHKDLKKSSTQYLTIVSHQGCSTFDATLILDIDKVTGLYLEELHLWSYHYSHLLLS